MFVRIFQKVKGVTMRNLRDTIFYMKANVFARFSHLHECTFNGNFIVCATAAFKSVQF